MDRMTAALRLSVIPLVMGTATAVFATDVGIFDATGQYAGSYLCIGDAAGGARYNSTLKRWESMAFLAQGEKLIVTATPMGVGEFNYIGLPTKVMRYQVMIKRFGQEGIVLCESPNKGSRDSPIYDAMFSDGAFECNSFYFSYRVDFKTLRFAQTYFAGFIRGPDYGDDDPAITVGRCTKLP